MLRTKNSSVLRCSLNSIRRHESNDPKKPKAIGYYPLGNPARLWGPALQQTLTNWAIPGALWMAAGVATVLYYTSWNPYTALIPPKPEPTPAEASAENVEASDTQTRRRRPARCDSQRNSEKAFFGAHYQEEQVDPEQINLKKCDPEPEFEERKYVFGQTTRKVKNPKKTEQETKEAEKTAENVAYNLEQPPNSISLWSEVSRFIGFQSKSDSEETSESSNTELRQYVFGQTKRPVKVSTHVEPLGHATEETASYWTQMRRIIGVETKPASNTVGSDIPSNVGKEMKSQTKSMDKTNKNKKSRNSPPPIPPPLATSSDSHSELDDFKPPRRPPKTDGSPDKVDSPPGYWNRSLTSIKDFFVRKNDD